MNTLLVTLFLIVLYVVEAFHDNYSIRGGETNTLYNARWHQASALFHLIMWFMISCFQHDLIYLILGASVRIVVFQNLLNILRDKTFFYIGAGNMDGWLTRTFGKIAPYLIFSVGVTLVVLINILKLTSILKNIWLS